MTDDHAERLIATATLLLNTRGKSQESELLRQSEATIEWYKHDWGTDFGRLHLDIPVVFYFKIQSQINSLQESIVEVTRELSKHNEDIDEVIIKPKLEAPENWRKNTVTLADSQFGLPQIIPQHRSDIFMIMPFQGNSLDVVYRDHICLVARRLNLTIKRGDDFFTKRSIMDDIWNAINAAKIIIADCTGRNPNVFYELGIAHTLGKKTIMITQNGNDVPFDLKQWRYMEYQVSSQGLKDLQRQLSNAIKSILGETDNHTPSPDEIPF